MSSYFHIFLLYNIIFLYIDKLFHVVNPGSAADDAGVQVNDIIAYIDGVPLSHMFAHTDKPNAREVGTALNRSKRQQGYVGVRFRAPAI